MTMFDFEGTLADLAIKVDDKKINEEFKGLSGRQRPRNSNKKETLLRWEKERKGIKIGTI
ncbi:hypothetical protein [Vagococcus hydrophili]|uniref:Uncharacterized protein n=1 Tax=Vagococcus hydrophili TaxID=2714947 RepID=A0A6G8ARP6_9ENTE|nr:hypothetical protein [Vagococcus hydrophili]QIL47595.1 hypothetical protein G7082_03105 [Vagococcus hydrophili]